MVEALGRPADRRLAFLRRACASDAALCREAESLLDAHLQSGDFLERLDLSEAGCLLDESDEALIDSDVGPYRIVRMLGRGGMGVVYLAHDTRLERRVAVKFLPAWLAADAEARRRLVAEARATAALDHPYIAIVHEIGETDEGQPFIAMAYYEGETLAARLRREKLPVPEALRLIAQLARGIGAAHAQGCVHCDIKPSNVLLTSPDLRTHDGSVRIVDFGVARHLGDGPAAMRAIAGTAPYLAPERTRGAPPDIRTDLWSIGVVLYEMLAGRLPFTARDDRTLVDVIRSLEPDSVENARPDVPPALDQIIRKLLRKNPEERYRDTGALLADLERLAQSWPAVPRPRRSGNEPKPAAATGRLAVLPLANANGDARYDYLPASLTHELISRLSRLNGLRVIAGAASMQFGGSTSRIAAIGLELTVSAVLTGSVRKDDVGFHLTVELIDAVTEELIWSGAYHAGGDALAVQRRIAEQVAQAMRLEANAGGHGHPNSGTRDQAAYEHYLRGRYYADRFDEPSAALARTEFQHALDRDPAFAAAWAGLSDTYKVFDYLSLLAPGEAAARARAAAERALALDPDLSAAHTSLASVLADFYWEWDAAGRHFRRAIELDPSYATGRHLYAEFLRDMGVLDEALEQIRTARELDPLSPFYELSEGTILLACGRTDASVRLYERLIDAHPGYRAARFYAGLAYLHRGQIDQALAMMEAYDPQAETPDALSLRGAIFAMQGRLDEARRILHRLDDLAAFRYVSPFHRGFVHFGLGEAERALDLIEQSVAERNWFVRLLKCEPMFDPLRAQPRFQAILEKVGLAPPK
jgi:serine/threonine-protein kinase